MLCGATWPTGSVAAKNFVEGTSGASVRIAVLERSSGAIDLKTPTYGLLANRVGDGPVEFGIVFRISASSLVASLVHVMLSFVRHRA